MFSGLLLVSSARQLVGSFFLHVNNVTPHSQLTLCYDLKCCVVNLINEATLHGVALSQIACVLKIRGKLPERDLTLSLVWLFAFQ